MSEPKPLDLFKVTTRPDGQTAWWDAFERVPESHRDIRVASIEEASLMNRIMRQNGTGVMPDLELCDRLYGMLNDIPEMCPDARQRQRSPWRRQIA